MGASRTMSFGAPGRYIQGPGEINRVSVHTKKYGSSVFAVIDPYFFASMHDLLKTQYEADGQSFQAAQFENEVTVEWIHAHAEAAKACGANVIMGIGGGKSIDTAKGVANELQLPVVIIPTSASTDAPTSALSVIYKENHEHSHAINYIKSPDMVLIDSTIIANAPVRFLVSGMGDAMATWFEAQANAASNSGNYICQEAGCFRRTRTAMKIAQFCYETILDFGEAAKIANENHVVTDALEAVIEANTLMSGLGFENTACACAHAVGDGITATPNGAATLHGEKVAFGTLCQLVAENASWETIKEYVEFCKKVGLPTTLADLQVELTEENLQLIADNVSQPELVREPFEISSDMLKEIVKAADAIGHHITDGM